ncbi:glycine-rich domain-containing protein [Aurantimonas sp. A2-1-M11]|uniref:glycine-rich domain-containing protein n=1 Tax=Aurantimonas sp. A2-1-M11 TaxID=3113712 RepID=UPI003FA5DACC
MTRISALPTTSFPSLEHEFPTSKEGESVKLTLDQVRTLLAYQASEIERGASDVATDLSALENGKADVSYVDEADNAKLDLNGDNVGANAAALRLALGAVGNLHKVTHITTSGTHTYDTATKAAEIVVIGAGASGGAGATTGTDQAASASGGNAGGRAIRLKELGAVTSAIIVIGAGGAAATSNSGVSKNGNNGGDSSYSDGVHTLTGNGGVAGVGSGGVNTIGSAPGPIASGSSGGTLNISSHPTSAGIAIGSTAGAGIMMAVSSDGGVSPYGSAGRGGVARGATSSAAFGEDASGYGAGGGGGSRIGSATGGCSSGAGAPGLVIIREYR